MKQLKYNDNFNDIIEDIELFNNDTIPSFLRDFIINISNNRVIHDDAKDKYFCPNCFRELDKKHICPNCLKKYKWKIFNTFDIDNIDDEISNDKDFYYYYFDISNYEPILYEIKETIYLYRTTHITKIRKISIERVFLVKKDRLIDLINLKNYNYQKCFNEIKETINDFDSNDYNEIDEINMDMYDFFIRDYGYLYTENIYELKNTIYKYTNYWECKNYLKENVVPLYELTILPLYNPNFEYLVKYGLYNLAFYSDLIEFKNSFKNTFKLDKEFLPFMKKYDINIDELSILKMTKKKDIRYIRMLARNRYILEDIYNEYCVDINKIVDYFKKKNYSYNSLVEYRDYLRLCKEFGFDFKDKKLIFPNNLIMEHNKLAKQYEITRDKKIDKKIRRISKILEINKYEDDNYVIYPAPNLESMIMEASSQNNCLRSYCNLYAEGKTSIFFMRDKKNINKSLVTIEIKNNKVIQARGKNNSNPSSELNKIINKWESRLIPIDFSK